MSEDPLDIKAQELAQKDREKRAKRNRDDEISDLKWLMKERRGRRIVWRQLEAAGVFRLSFNTNAMQMAFAEGNRNYGLHLLGMIHEHCPEVYPVMVREANERVNVTDDGNSAKPTS